MVRSMLWRLVPGATGGVWAVYLLVCGILATGAAVGATRMAGRPLVGWVVGAVFTVAAGWTGQVIRDRWERERAATRRGLSDGS